ncbi:MAG: ribosome hibernation-promoting factor, HPF/YfiA family [Candidatus Binataceae bacterium]
MLSKIMRGKRSRKAARQERRKGRLEAAPETAVEVTFRHIEPTEAIRQYAERKLAHLAKFLKRPGRVHLILSVDKYRHHGEVTFKSGPVTIAAEEETKDLYSVVDLLADKVGRQLKRHQEKTETRRAQAQSAGEVLSAEMTTAPGPERA